MSRVNTEGIQALLNFYRTNFVRARVYGNDEQPGGGSLYISDFQNITWTNVSTGTDGSGRPTGNINLSTPLEWTDIPADVTALQIDIFTATGTTPIARYSLDEPRTFLATGTLRINTLPTNLNSKAA